MKLSIEERIAQLEARKRALKARLTKTDRARDTRRKVLLGALLLQQIEEARDPEFRQRLTAWLKGELPGFLTRDEDRKLFPEFIGVATDAMTIDMDPSPSTSPHPQTAPVIDHENRQENRGGDRPSQAN